MSQLRKVVNPILRAIKEGNESKKHNLFEETCNHLLGVASRYAINKDD